MHLIFYSNWHLTTQYFFPVSLITLFEVSRTQLHTLVSTTFKMFHVHTSKLPAGRWRRKPIRGFLFSLLFFSFWCTPFSFSSFSLLSKELDHHWWVIPLPYKLEMPYEWTKNKNDKKQLLILIKKNFGRIITFKCSISHHNPVLVSVNC